MMSSLNLRKCIESKKPIISLEKRIDTLLKSYELIPSSYRRDSLLQVTIFYQKPLDTFFSIVGYSEKNIPLLEVEDHLYNDIVRKIQNKIDLQKPKLLSLKDRITYFLKSHDMILSNFRYDSYHQITVTFEKPGNTFWRVTVQALADNELYDAFVKAIDQKHYYHLSKL